MFGAIAGGIASALAGGAMSKLFGGGQKAASGDIQGDVLATDNNTVGMGDAGIKSAIQGSNVPNPDEAVPSFVSGAMAKAGKGLLEGTLQAGTSAVSDKLLDLVGLGGKSAADKGKDTRDYLAAAFPELNAWERAGAAASAAGMVDAGLAHQQQLPKMQPDNQKEIAGLLQETHAELAGRPAATARENASGHACARTSSGIPASSIFVRYSSTTEASSSPSSLRIEFICWRRNHSRCCFCAPSSTSSWMRRRTCSSASRSRCSSSASLSRSTTST